MCFALEEEAENIVVVIKKETSGYNKTRNPFT